MPNRSNSSGNGEGKRVGLWIRVSTEDQARGESPEHHEARGRMYAEAKGWTVVTVYHLEGVSGKGVLWHPEAKRMKGDVESGAITGLIFSKLARLARSAKELLEFSEFFREHNADLISLQESIDTSTPAGRLFYTVIAAMAQWEREEIADRVAASVPIRAKLGKRIAGAAPFGYAWKDGKLVPDEKEAPVRRLMYELFRETKRIRTVARLLNERGYRTRKDGLFTGQAVYQLLFDPTAKGVLRMNYTTQRNGKKTLKPEHEWVYHPVPAIVSEDLWNECTAYLTKRKEGMKPGRRGVHLFSGLTYCACGKKDVCGVGQSEVRLPEVPDEDTD
jgi:site-specific DNA recombinase